MRFCVGFKSWHGLGLDTPCCTLFLLKMSPGRRSEWACFELREAAKARRREVPCGVAVSSSKARRRGQAAACRGVVTPKPGCIWTCRIGRRAWLLRFLTLAFAVAVAYVICVSLWLCEFASMGGFAELKTWPDFPSSADGLVELWHLTAVRLRLGPFSRGHGCACPKALRKTLVCFFNLLPLDGVVHLLHMVWRGHWLGRCGVRGNL